MWARRNNAVFEPETRLTLLLFLAIIVVLGLTYGGFWWARAQAFLGSHLRKVL